MRYRDVYPEPPLLHSHGLAAPTARDLLTLEDPFPFNAGKKGGALVEAELAKVER